jgi:MFS family permease
LSRARVAVTAVFLVHGGLFGTWGARIPAIKRSLELSNAELGLALLTAMIGGLAALPVAGWLVGRVGSRAAVTFTLPPFVLLVPVLALAPGLVSLALVLFAWGAAGCILDVGMNAHGIAVERHLASPILSSLHAGWSAGGLLGAGAGAVAAHAGVDPLWHFTAAAMLLGALGLAARRLLLPGSGDRATAGNRLALPPRGLIPLAVVAFCGLFGESAAYDWSTVYVAGPIAAGAGTAALAFAAFSVAMAAVRIAGDRLTTRFGHVRLLRVGGLASAGGLALALVTHTAAVALVGFAIMGCGLATLVPIVFRVAASIPGLPPGTGIAALATVGYAAFLAAPPAIGFSASGVGLRSALWLVVALQLVLVVCAPVADADRYTT